MEKDAQEHVRRSMQDNPEIWIAAARFDSLRGANWEERLTLVMAAADIDTASSLADWRHEIRSSYQPLASNPGSGHSKIQDAKARALYIQKALIRLLELVDAPTSILNDARAILELNQPKDASKRAAVQAALIAHPELAENPGALAKKAGCSRRLVDRCLDDGSVRTLP